MKAVQFNFTYARYGLGLALGKVFPPVLWNGLSCTGLREVDEPELPGDDWVRVKTLMSGVCGTDLGAIHLHTSPYYSPFSSFPFTLGHENVGELLEIGNAVKGWKVGDRVVVEPTLWCAPRGFAKEDWCEFCARGDIHLCQRYSEGKLAPGILIGTCRDTGGSWSPNFVAHSSQLYRVPLGLSDEDAMMLEPFACAMHAVLADFPEDDETILIIGAGTLGLLVVAALRALGSQARVLVSARYEFQVEAARRLGADAVLFGGDLYRKVAEHTGAKLLKPTIGKRVVLGGADRVYECVGSDSAMDDALRLACTGGTVVIVGMPGLAKGIDWTAIYSQELKVLATDRGGQAEPYQDKVWKGFELAMHLMQEGKLDLGWMVSRRYALEDYQKALNDLSDKKRHAIIKAVFAFK
jgi:threonine dehydrogenase-like Zn-dependent dehydrogenase